MPIIVRNFTHYASPCILYLYYTTYTIKANVYNALFVTVHCRLLQSPAIIQKNIVTVPARWYSLFW